MDLDEMKSNWNELNARVDNLEAKNREMMNYIWSNKVCSAREKLMFQYRRFIFVGSIMAVTMSLTRGDLFPWYLKIAFVSFFLIAAAMDLYLYRGIKSIDVNTFTVNDVARKALFYRRRHHIFQVILLAIGVPMLSVQFWIATESYMRWGMLTGIIVGLVIGISAYLSIMRNYKSLMK